MQKSETRSTQRSRIASVIRSIGTGRLFVLSIITTVVAMGLLLALFQFVVTVTGASSSKDPWPLLEGFMSMLTVALLLGGGLFALTEYIEGEEARRTAEEERLEAEQQRRRAEEERSKQQSFALYDSLFQRLMHKNEIDVRAWIIRNVPPYQDGDHDTWVAQTRETLFHNPQAPQPNFGQGCVKHVLNTFDYLGFVALNYWELDPSLMDWLNPMVTKVWDRIGPYVEEEALRREEPNYYFWAREFCKQACAWRDQKHLPPPKYVEDAL